MQEGAYGHRRSASFHTWQEERDASRLSASQVCTTALCSWTKETGDAGDALIGSPESSCSSYIEFNFYPTSPNTICAASAPEIEVLTNPESPYHPFRESKKGSCCLHETVRRTSRRPVEAIDEADWKVLNEKEKKVAIKLCRGELDREESIPHQLWEKSTLAARARLYIAFDKLRGKDAHTAKAEVKQAREVSREDLEGKERRKAFGFAGKLICCVSLLGGS